MVDDSTLTIPGARVRRRPDPRASLRAVHPGGLDFTLRLGRDPAVVGRGEGGVGNRSVSREHVEIRQDEGHHVVRDLDSRNGSWLDGETLDGPRALADGSVLRLGEVLFVYESGADPHAAPDVDLEAVPGDALATRTLRGRLARAAVDPAPCLLVGETGVGKERVAQEVHRLSSRPGPMVAINCAALSPQLVESQLFGHARGAFTGATAAHGGLFRAADRGTLFLDEVGDLPLELQPKLLRALQEGEVLGVGETRPVKVDVRVVAATHQPLPRMVEAGTFRRDLYARLALWELEVPPLRRRRVDLLAWFARLHATWAARRSGTAPLRLDVEVAERLLLDPWPENLRGLDRVVHRLASSAEAGVVVDLRALDEVLPTGTPPEPVDASRPSRPSKPTRQELEAVLGRMSVRAAARHFDRDRRQIYRWMDTYGLREVTGEG